MPFKLDALDLLRWLHFVAMAAGFGAGIVALLLSGFEEGREDLQGLAATVWSRVVAWAFRLALVVGAVLFVHMMRVGQNPLALGPAFHAKLLLALLLVGVSEAAPGALARGRRGAALLAVVLFLAATFLMFNRGLFRSAPKLLPPPVVTAR